MSDLISLCACGHRKGLHLDGFECGRMSCSCNAYTRPEVLVATEGDPTFHPVPKAAPAPKKDARATHKGGERAPEPKGVSVGNPAAPEAGKWRAMIEDLSTGTLYLVVRGAKPFVDNTLSSYLDRNPLPLTKRAVVSQDMSYISADPGAPFFRDGAIRADWGGNELVQ